VRMAVTWAGARIVVTWAIARKAAELILPMSLETLTALTWVMVCSAAQSSQIEMVLVWAFARKTVELVLPMTLETLGGIDV